MGEGPSHERVVRAGKPAPQVTVSCTIAAMSWEANRWTAKTPSELYHTLGPHGVDDLVRQMIASCWRSLPDDARSLASGIARAGEVYQRNVNVWKRIKKP